MVKKVFSKLKYVKTYIYILDDYIRTYYWSRTITETLHKFKRKNTLWNSPEGNVIININHSSTYFFLLFILQNSFCLK